MTPCAQISDTRFGMPRALMVSEARLSGSAGLQTQPSLTAGFAKGPFVNGALPDGRASDTRHKYANLSGTCLLMPFFDLLRLAFRNLREAKLRATLTSMGVIVGVAVIVTMVSFGLGLQRNLLSRFKALDLFNEMTVFGKSFAGAFNFDRPPGRR